MEERVISKLAESENQTEAVRSGRIHFSSGVLSSVPEEEEDEEESEPFFSVR